METVDHLLLIFGGLSAEAEDLGSERLYFPVVVPHRTALWGATAGSSDVVPAGRRVLIGLTSPGIYVDHGAWRCTLAKTTMRLLVDGSSI